jgi:hypothetical protein
VRCFCVHIVDGVLGGLNFCCVVVGVQLVTHISAFCVTYVSPLAYFELITPGSC